MLDPDNEGAKTLLTSSRSASDPVPPNASSTFTETAIHSPAVAVAVEQPLVVVTPAPVMTMVVPEPQPVVIAPSPAPAPIPAPVAQPHVSRVESPVYDYVPPPELRRHPDEMGFTTGTATAVQPARSEKRPSLTIPIAVVLVAVLGGGFFLVRQRYASSSNATPSPAPTANIVPETPQPQPGPITPAQKTTPSTPVPASSPNNNTSASPKLVATNDAVPPLPNAAASSASSASPARPNAPAAATAGSLAVNSSISAEIYVGDKYLGSTPTTLQFPAGNQTVEYRHGDLRAVVTHVIKPNETTTANITFDAIVQVNARPWAQVYVDGIQRVPLGQTPLSNVKLPIGSVLVFENPNFPSKSHKIAADDKTIQMVFQ